MLKRPVRERGNDSIHARFTFHPPPFFALLHFCPVTDGRIHHERLITGDRPELAQPHLEEALTSSFFAEVGQSVVHF